MLIITATTIFKMVVFNLMAIQQTLKTQQITVMVQKRSETIHGILSKRDLCFWDSLLAFNTTLIFLENALEQYIQPLASWTTLNKI